MPTQPTLRISRRAADRLRSGHLWVYRTDIEASQPEPGAGALVTVTDPREVPLGTALYSTASQIAARLVSRTPGLTRSQYRNDLRERLATAIRRRKPVQVMDAVLSNACRLVFSEGDNLPGIVLDEYNGIVVAQLLIQGTAQDDVRQVLAEAVSSSFVLLRSLWERPDPRIQELEQLPVPPSIPLFATDQEQPATSTYFFLNGLKFHFDVAAGQKTGAFLDQRLNYDAAEQVVDASGLKGRALDVCTYHGGFALHLARVCKHVVGVDTSMAALRAADRNLTANEDDLDGSVQWVEADAFDYLRHLDEAKGGNEGNLWDAIVLDPPAFAKSRRAAEGAARGYKELNLRAIRLLRPGGTLITNSCSHHVSLADFTGIVAAAAADTGRRVQLLETRAAAPDHPEVLTLPETRYLKCLICRID